MGMSEIRALLGVLENQTAEPQEPDKKVEDAEHPEAPPAPPLEERDPIVGVPEIIRMMEGDLTDEIKAAAVYAAQAEVAPSPETKALLLHLEGEERAHIVELKSMIAKLQGEID